MWLGSNFFQIQALNTVLKSGGFIIDKVLNIPNSYNFAKHKQKYLLKTKNIGVSI